MTRIPVALKRLAPPGWKWILGWIYDELFDRYRVPSYSQEGEDIVLGTLFAEHHAGFYVDVGAHHPRRFSNTYLFYLRGWSGINIDAMPGSMRPFRRKRPRDINVEAAVSDRAADLIYHAFDEPALTSFSAEMARQRIAEGSGRLLWTKTLRTRTLSELLAEHLPPEQKIDFLSVDVEGHDLEVLRSLDWRRYRPEAVVVEVSQPSVREVLEHAIHAYLSSLGYVLYSKFCNSCIYVGPEHARAHSSRNAA